MWKLQLKLIIVIFSLTKVYTLKISNPPNPIHHLSHLVSDKYHKPLIVVVNTKPQRGTNFDDLLLDGIDNVTDDDESHQTSQAKDDSAYILYHLLRTTKQDDLPDSLLKEAKVALRQALRARCQKVEMCVIKCPPKKPQCPVNCKQVFDNLDLCPPKPKKDDCRPKCGRTMPPKWFF